MSKGALPRCPSCAMLAGGVKTPSRACCGAGRMEMHQQGCSINEVLRHRPSAESPMLQRELASIHRQVCRHCSRAITSQTHATTSLCWLW